MSDDICGNLFMFIVVCNTGILVMGYSVEQQKFDLNWHKIKVVIEKKTPERDTKLKHLKKTIFV